MIASIVRKLSPHWPQMRPNFTWKFNDEKEEFDLIVADPRTHSLLICEMRWTIQPGDPREVAQRKKNCFEKVSQLERKVEWLRPRLHTAVTEIFGIETTLENPWEIVGLVVVDGFGGVMSPNGDLPIMPARIFERAMPQVESLQVLKNWSKSLAWLPQEDVFFEMKWRELELEGKRINYQGMIPLQERPDFLQHIDRTIMAAKTQTSRG
ncbi:hypothetical protein CLU92_3786 [Janthinobacterium sp. 61]|uniref:hypothetical protein n=1 Tax=Janthinobacterium sp. 61 TaxID=2035209 RepID=UPI000C707482|nr:hypothetical protein [Janthinobacterium sp. 61]PKV46379.1 hypothetical protein CLU92_3786 [Janthinobacterium sp. 61]